METSSYKQPLHLLCVFHFIILCTLCFISNVDALTRKISSIYVFGDSTVDPGNNNYITTAFKGNFPPYGIDFVNHVPTGRFSNGRLATDLIASYAGIKHLVPPYMDPNLSFEELLTGVSFASAGSGFDPLTPLISGVFPIPKQMEYFRECKKRLESVIGKQRTEEHIKKAVFFISAGTNDFVVNYFTIPIRRRSYTTLSYHHFLMQHIKQFIQDLWSEGARNIAVAGLPPMGCLPVVITINSENAFLQRECIDKFSSAARDYNLILQNELHFMQTNLSNSRAKLTYIDTYGPLAYMIQGQGNFGFDKVDCGCCGSGYIEASFLCNGNSYVCSNASKYVFFDSIHPTEMAYYTMFKASRATIDHIINH